MAESSLSLTFLPGEMVLTVNVTTLDDDVLEREEEFEGRLELAEGGEQGSGVTLGRSVAMATILDDDGIIWLIKRVNVRGKICNVTYMYVYFLSGGIH